MTSGRNRATVAMTVAALTTGGLAGCAQHSASARGSSATAPVVATQPASRQESPSALPSATPTEPPTSPTPVTTAPPQRVRDGLPPVISKIPTKDKVVFITIDDGWQKDADFVQLVKDRKIPITVFLLNDAARGDYGYFRRLQQAGALIEDHSMTHPLMTRLTYTQQKYQICRTADIYTRQYGTRPTLFRAPYGASNTTTRRAARDCGMKAIFFWRETSQHGNLAYQVAGGLHSGDIILVHFKPHMARDFRTLLQRIHRQGYRPAAFKDYLPAGYFQQSP